MRYPNTAQLKGWLVKDKLTVLADQDAFELDDAEYTKHLADLEKGTRPEKEWLDAAAFRCLTSGKAVRVEKSLTPQQVLVQQDQILKAYAAKVEEERQYREEQRLELRAVLSRVGDAQTHILAGQHQVYGWINEGIKGLHREIVELRAEAASAKDAIRGHVDAVVSGIHEESAARTSRYRWTIIGLLVLLGIVLFTQKGYSQNTNPAIRVPACGTAPANYPADGSRAPLTTDGDGNLCAGVSVSATVATAGLAISVSVGASSSGVPVTPTGGVVSTSAPTWSNGTIVPFSFEADGDLRVAASVTPPALQNVNVTQVQSQPAATNGNGVLAVAGATSAGLIVQGSTSGAAVQVNFLTAAPTVTVTDGSGALNTIIDSGTVTAVTTITNPVTVTDGAGALNVILDSGTLSTFPDNEPFNVAQWGGTAVVAGATAGTVPVAVVQAAAPSGLTDGAFRALSLDQTNALRVNVVAGSSGNAAASATGSGVPASADYQGVRVGANLVGATGEAVSAAVGQHVVIASGSGLTVASMPTVTVTDGAGALNTIVDSGTLTAVTSITNPVTVTNVTELSTIRGALIPNAGSGAVAVIGITSSGTTAVGGPVLVGALSGTASQSLTVSTVRGGLNVTPSGYTSSVAWGSSVNLAVTNTALVTVASGTRIVLHRANFLCGSTVSAAVTVSLGFATATLPTTGAGLVWAGMVTSASSFQGIQDGTGFPNVLGVGASDEDLRLTMTAPTGGACTVSLTYSTEIT